MRWPWLAPPTRSSTEDGDVVDLQLTRVWIVDAEGRAADRAVHTVHVHTGAAELGPYRHYMQKEIFEQPRAVGDTLQDIESVTPELFGDDAYKIFKDIDSVLVGLRHQLLRRPDRQVLDRVRRQDPGECRNRQRIPLPRQRAEPARAGGDDLAVRRNGRHAGRAQARALAGHAAHADHLQRGHQRHGARVQAVYITRAGVEIGVASTKAFTTQLTGLFLLTLALAQVRGNLTAEQEAAHIKSLRHLPAAIGSVLALEPQIMAWADRFASKENALFLGRGMHYPIALEGALKLKEISYIHAEAYPAGELKHGPLALVTEHMPVVTIAPRTACWKS